MSALDLGSLTRNVRSRFFTFLEEGSIADLNPQNAATARLTASQVEAVTAWADSNDVVVRNFIVAIPAEAVAHSARRLLVPLPNQDAPGVNPADGQMPAIAPPAPPPADVELAALRREITELRAGLNARSIYAPSSAPPAIVTARSDMRQERAGVADSLIASMSVEEQESVIRMARVGSILTISGLARGKPFTRMARVESHFRGDSSNGPTAAIRFRHGREWTRGVELPLDATDGSEIMITEIILGGVNLPQVGLALAASEKRSSLDPFDPLTWTSAYKAGDAGIHTLYRVLDATYDTTLLQQDNGDDTSRRTEPHDRRRHQLVLMDWIDEASTSPPGMLRVAERTLCALLVLKWIKSGEGRLNDVSELEARFAAGDTLADSVEAVRQAIAKRKRDQPARDTAKKDQPAKLPPKKDQSAKDTAKKDQQPKKPSPPPKKDQKASTIPAQADE